MNLIAIDTETRLIGKGQTIPPMVCTQFATLEEGVPFSWVVEKAKQGYAEEILEYLSDDSFIWIFHNAAYDLSVISKQIPEAMPLIWKAFDEDRIRDTMIREMLYNLTLTGDIENIEVNGITQRAEYSLAALTKKHTGVDRSADKEGEDTVRMNYEMVEHLLLEDWPDEFVEYAEHDPADTLLVFLDQEIARESLKNWIGYDPFVTECFRVKVHFCLQLMTNIGNKLDKEEVLRVTQEFDTLYNDPKLVEPLVLSHFIEQTAKENGLEITEQFVSDCLDLFAELPEKEQKKWIGTGMVKPAVPPLPYANGAKAHTEECIYNKNGPNYIGKSLKDCECPVKMKGAQKEKGSNTSLHKYIWNAALRTEAMEVWASDSLKKKLREEGTFDEFIQYGKIIDQEAVTRSIVSAQVGEDAKDIPDSQISILSKTCPLPDKWRVSVDKEWLASFALLDPVLEKLSIRRKYQKIITSYLPGLYWNDNYTNCPDLIEGETDRLAQKEPADVVHSCFRPLKLTGRTSSYANTRGTGKNKIYMFPSMNGQQVDPRIRPCIIPRDGYKLFSIDYSAMELGTAAQTCIDLFGFSVLGDVINSGRCAHSYLGMFIAQEFDDWFNLETRGLEADELYDTFAALKGSKDPCISEVFAETWKAMGKDTEPTLGDFWKHYRTFAKPTGLGYWGGLGPKTMVTLAKGQYGLVVSIEECDKVREIWYKVYPESKKYLDHVSSQCLDPVHKPEMREDDEGNKYKKKFYAYDTPMGMHRAKADFCACANGKALQSISAEGALLGLCEIQREIHCGEFLTAETVRPTIFVHDEVFGEIRDDELLTARIEYMQEIMKDCMEVVTPDVQASTEACIMNRWSKSAFPYFVDGALRPYEEKLEKDKQEEERCY